MTDSQVDATDVIAVLRAQIADLSVELAIAKARISRLEQSSQSEQESK